MSVLGKTRSGKSTALYRHISELVPLRWSKILVLDGKRDVLRFAASDSRVKFYNNTQIADWNAALATIAEGMAARYDAIDAGKDPAPVLILADEIQAGTRDKENGRSIRQSLMLISEQSGALGDCMILATQRPQNAIPPAVLHNCNCSLTMLGHGYFHFRADDIRPKIGRASFITFNDAEAKMLAGITDFDNAATLQPLDLLQMLKPETADPKDGRLTVITGESGSGLTHRLMSYPQKKERTVFVDCAALTHKQMLEDVLMQCSAATPPKAKISELVTMAGLAIASRETLLLVDNLHTASAKTQASIQSIIPYAAETAVTFATPVLSKTKIGAFEWYIARGNRDEIEPLNRAEANRLAMEHLDPTITNGQRLAAARRITQISHGHARTVVAAAKSVETGQADELRKLEGRQVDQWSLLWLLVAFIIVIVVINSERMNSYTATAVVLVVMLILRRLLSRSLTTVIPRR